MSEDEFWKLWTNLVDRTHQGGGLPLSDCERLFYTVNLLRGSVPRSGFIGYFENSTGLDISSAQEGLKAMGLGGVLSILEDALKAAFESRPIPADSSLIEVVPTSLPEEEFMAELDRIAAALDPIEMEFCKHDEEIWAALCRYAEAHHLKPQL